MTLNKERLEVAFEAYWAAEGGTFKGIEAAIAAYLETERRKIIEECAKVVEPKQPRPCDCERCDCGNHGDMAAVAAWDADAANARAIMALCAEAKDYDAMLASGVIPESLRDRFKSA
jgi:hypothetical protein